ncbi:MAG: methionine synthase I [Alphaproteobacteria bacterium HGW-Alphaproteobacteria-8]|nr:MAG: methionine synthase I [Alphaproteobacteria bacterium HGW-Alphaproteobacteria-8]
MDALSKLLAEREWLMADGATGTTLFNAGLMSGDAPEMWNFDNIPAIQALHDGFIAAGSDIILTNSFGGTRARLKLHKAEDRAFEINQRAAEIARDRADRAGRTVVVAGSMGPTGEILEPVGALTHAEAVALFEEQGRGLMAGGADVLWAETISSEEEIRAIAEAAANIGAPLCATLSFDTSGRTMMGLTSSAYAALVPTLAAQPLAFGANCGVGAADLVRTVIGLTETAPDAVVIAKANAGIPKYVDGHIHYDGTPALMADYAVLARDAGARIIGGCCGTQPAHLVAMRAALLAHGKGPRPTLDAVAARLGGFSSGTDGVTGGDAAVSQHTRRGRRRS